MNYTNEDYASRKPLWNYVSDCFDGVRAIKSLQSGKCFLYLPPFPSERKNLSETGQYMLRLKYADYDNIFKSTILAMVGIMTKSAVRTVLDGEPPEVASLESQATLQDDGITALKFRLNLAQLLYGRCGLLMDFVKDSSGAVRFFVKEYPVDSILDGENYESPTTGLQSLKWCLLDVSTKDFNYQTKVRETKERLLLLGIDGSGRYYKKVFEKEAISQWSNFDIDNPADAFYPIYKGNYLPVIPMSICNVDKLGIDKWQSPPFIDIAYSAINSYNIDSVYKKALINHSTPTLVITNVKVDDEIKLGDMLAFESSAEKPVTANLLQTASGGIMEIGNAVRKIKEDAIRQTVQGLMDSIGANTSGTAISLRTAAGTANIASIDRLSAMALREQLRYASLWCGKSWADTSSINVEVDTSYMNSQGTVQEFVQMLTANTGADGRKFLSDRNLYGLLQTMYPNKLTSYEENELQKDEEGMSAMPMLSEEAAE